MYNIPFIILFLFCIAPAFADYEACVTYYPSTGTYTIDQYGNINRCKECLYKENYGSFAEDWGEDDGFGD